VKLRTSASIVLCFVAESFAETESIPYQELHRIPIEKVPERTLVTGMLTTHGNASTNGYVHLLDRLPENWTYQGRGRITLSEKYSRAGAKSIRWDWRAGDLIRIKDVGILSDVRVGFTGFNAKSEEIAPFALYVFKDRDLPPNTPIELYFKRATDDQRGERRMRLTKMRYFMNFTGTWYKMGGVALKAQAELFGQGNHLKVIEKMPQNLEEPALDEIVIRAPTEVGSGTFYFDRLITLAEIPDQEVMDARGKTDYLDLGFTSDGKLTDNRAWPFDLGVEADLATIGFTDEPIDPLKFNQADTGYYGYLARKPSLAKSLTKEQKSYVRQLKDAFFVVPNPLKPEDSFYAKIEKEAKEILDRDCIRLPGGKYKFRESINFGGDRIYFAGDRCTVRKHIYNFPEFEQRNDLFDLDVKTLFLRYGDWLARCPESKPVNDLFKAYLDWFRYQVCMPQLATLGGSDSAITGHFAKYGGSWLVKEAPKMIAVLRNKKNPEDSAYAAYIGEIIVWMSKIQSYTFAVDPLPGIGREWSADTTYYGLFYEPDDAKFFQLLKASQEAFTRTFSISEINRRGMIKPDYTFFHHGHCSYWGGNFYVHLKKASQFAHTPLEFSPTIRRNLAWYVPRYCFGAYNFPSTVKGGQESTNNTLRFKHWLKDRLGGGKGHGMVEGVGKPSRFSIDRFPNREVFEYLYEMDWKEIPSAKKFMAGVLGMTNHQPEEIRKSLIEEYPKLKSIAPQTDIHLSLNWSGATSYSTGMTRVQVGSYNDMDPTPSRPHGRWSWPRGYGCLYLLENDRVGSRPPLGADYEGYSWSKTPGVTMPAVTDEEYLKHHVTDGEPRGKHGVELNSRGGPGNGSLTFNETEERFGSSGNFSFQTLKSENLKIWKELFDLNGVAGKKSYHFHGDKVVCLGSDYHADSERQMGTVLFQETLDPLLWMAKNPGRWNPDRQRLVLNGKSYQSDFVHEAHLDQSHYILSPFGHAWVIPSDQEGKLKIEWKERESLFNYRIGINSVTPGKRMTKGTGVIAWLDHGPSRKVSAHHYFILLNSDGKSPKALEASARQAMDEPGYRVLRHDSVAHALVFEEAGQDPLYSYVFHEEGKKTDLPYVQSVNKRLNLMFRKNGLDHITLSVCDPQVDIESDSSSDEYERSRSRGIRIRFAPKLNLELKQAISGLPQTNPSLGARIENNSLIFTTKNAVTDTFKLRIGKKS
jgi:hypothetical protein